MTLKARGNGRMGHLPRGCDDWTSGLLMQRWPKGRRIQSRQTCVRGIMGTIGVSVGGSGMAVPPLEEIDFDRWLTRHTNFKGELATEI